MNVAVRAEASALLPRYTLGTEKRREANSLLISPLEQQPESDIEIRE